jgi:hypothetical protein
LTRSGRSRCLGTSVTCALRQGFDDENEKLQKKRFSITRLHFADELGNHLLIFMDALLIRAHAGATFLD